MIKPETFQGICLDTLGEDGAQTIHEASLDILEQVGVAVHSADLRRFLNHSGALVDDTDLVRLRREVVLWALSMAPTEVTLWHRSGKGMALSAGNYVHGLAEGTLNIWDFAARKCRSSTQQDVADMTRLADALPNVEVLSHPVHAGDLPTSLAPLYNASITLANTTKHCMVGVMTAREFSFWVELAEILNQGCPLADSSPISVAVCTVSPLQLDEETAKIIMLAVRKGIPILALPAPMAGATSPVTAAGNLVVQNAEDLFLLTVAQLLAPGLPVIYGAAPFIMDLRSGVSSKAIEHPSWLSAVATLARFYRIPSYVSVGSSWTGWPGLRTGVQKVCYHMAALMSGISLTLGAGRVEAPVMSYEQLVIDDALVESLRRFCGVIDLEDSNGIEEAVEISNQRGRGLRGRTQLDTLFNSSELDSVETDLLERAHQRVGDILQCHRPAVPESDTVAINDYVCRKERELSSLK